MNDSKSNTRPIVDAIPLPEFAPDALRHLKAWVVWRYEGGGAKPLKVPYYTSGGRRKGVQGSPDDRAGLATFDEALAAAKASRGKPGALTGVGLALLPEFGIVALDFDNCVTDGDVHPDVLDLTTGTYAEISPSGRGVRAFLKGAMGDQKDAHGKPFGLEVFHSTGYVTYTGKQLPDAFLGDYIAPVSDEVKAYAAKRFGSSAAPAPVGVDDGEVRPPHQLGVREAKRLLEAIGPRDDYQGWLEVGMALHYDSGGSDRALAIWEEWSRGSDEWEDGATAAKWETFHRPDSQSTRLLTAGKLHKMAFDAGLLNAFANIDEDEGLADDGRLAGDGEERFVVESFDAARVITDIPWMIRDLLPMSGVGMIFGDSGSGKTFVALDLALAVARGIPWRGLQVEQRRVMYVAAEGGVSFSHRLEAYARYHGVSGLDFSVIRKEAPNFSDPVDVKWILRRVQEVGPCGLIVVDTLAQVTPGCDENAVKDMGVVMRRCTELATNTGALVLLIHHSGKDPARGARGSSAIRGALDFEAIVAREEPKAEGKADEEEEDAADRWATGGAGGYLKVTKQRAGEAGQRWEFKLEPVEVYASLETGVVRSCVVVDAARPSRTGPGRPTTWGRFIAMAIEKNKEAWAGGVTARDVAAAAVAIKESEDGKPADVRNAKRAVLAARDTFFHPGEGDTLVPLSDSHGV